MMRIVTFALTLLLSMTTLFGQNTEKRLLTIEDVLLLPNWESFSWSPNGDFIAFVKMDVKLETYEPTDHIWIYDTQSTSSYRLTNSVSGERNPRWLPDGRLLFNSDREGDENVFVISPSGGEATRFFDDDDAPEDGIFSNDYSRIAYTKQDEPDDKEERDKKREKGYDSYEWDAEQTEFDQIWAYDIAAREHTKLTKGPYNSFDPKWSPDDNSIAFTSNRSGEEESDNSDIWIVPSDGGQIRQLTTNPGPDQAPVWSPNGRTIAYQSSSYEMHQADHLELMIIPSGGGEPVNLTADYNYNIGGRGDGNPGWIPVWSPDGVSIYIAPFQETSRLLYRFAADGSGNEVILSDEDYLFREFHLSHNGSIWLFAGSSGSSPGGVFTANQDGSNVRKILNMDDIIAPFKLGRQEDVVWKGADGWDIDGILTYPVDYQPGKKYPAILMVHGGPDGLFTKDFDTRSQLWAAKGYLVLRGNPRGSSGHSFEFGMGNFKGWGGDDFTDLMKGVDSIVDLGLADSDRIAVIGGSYGGFMTFWAITQTDRFTAAIGMAAISNWYTLYAHTETDYAAFGFDGTPYNVRKLYDTFSPVNYVSNVTTPLLIIHGDEDPVVPVSQAVEYYTALKKHGKTVKFLRFPREGHGIREPFHRITLDKEQAAWLEIYLK